MWFCGLIIKLIVLFAYSGSGLGKFPDNQIIKIKYDGITIYRIPLGKYLKKEY